MFHDLDEPDRYSKDTSTSERLKVKTYPFIAEELNAGLLLSLELREKRKTQSEM